jgi:diadenosine tetraphosphate (Ap4A) HIT family hydrolase
MSCPFCNIDNLRDRVFYENNKWFAFLSAPFHTKGHAIVAEQLHVHLFPLWANEEDSWRKGKGDGYKKGHLMEFLGNLEKQGDEDAESKCRTRQITPEEYRREIIETLKTDVEELRKLTGYSMRIK